MGGRNGVSPKSTHGSKENQHEISHDGKMGYQRLSSKTWEVQTSLSKHTSVSGSCSVKRLIISDAFKSFKSQTRKSDEERNYSNTFVNNIKTFHDYLNVKKKDF